jgi:pilus assembly protein Flp/PilA
LAAAERIDAMLKLLKSFTDDESGATAIEYGLFAGLLAIGLTVSMSTVGASMGKIFQTVTVQLDHARDPSAIILTVDRP